MLLSLSQAFGFSGCYRCHLSYLLRNWLLYIDSFTSNICSKLIFVATILRNYDHSIKQTFLDGIIN